MHFFYAQDDWRISNKLTLNLGTRYELATPPFETNNQLSNFDPVTSPAGGLIVASSGSIANRALISEQVRLRQDHVLELILRLRSGHSPATLCTPIFS